MYNKTFVIPGLIILLLLMLSPVLYNLNAAPANLPETSMANHPYPTSTPMDEWKAGHMTYVNAESIAKCKGCHANTVEFCDKCHEYVGVRPSVLAK